MKALFITTILLTLPHYAQATSVEDCKARAALNQSYKLHELNQSKSGASMDKKFLIDRQIQNVEVQIIGDQAACEEESRYPNGDEKFSTKITEEQMDSGETLIHFEE